METTYDRFLINNNIQLTNYQRNVDFPRFYKHYDVAMTLINQLNTTEKCLAFAKEFNLNFFGESRLLVANLVGKVEVTAYKVGSVIVSLQLPCSKEYAIKLSKYKPYKGVSAFALDASDPFEIFLKKHNIELTTRQRNVLFLKYLNADFNYSNVLIKDLDVNAGWLKVAKIIDPNDISYPDARQWTACIMSNPNLTTLNILQAIVKAELPCAKKHCQILALFELPPQTQVIKTVEPHPVETASPNAVATRVIIEQMEQLKIKTEKEKQLEAEIARLRAAAAAPIANAAAASVATSEANANCVVCQDKEPTVVNIPCGHIACCTLCIDIIVKANQPCPVCRKEIERTVKTFRV